MAALEQEFAHRDLAVITVCVWSSTEEATEALQRAEVDLLTLLDTGEVSSSYQVRGTPTTYLIDHPGIIRTGRIGASNANDWRTEIERVL